MLEIDLQAIGLLSNNVELIEDFRLNIDKNFDLKYYRSFDSVKAVEVQVLAIDINFFKSSELLQFHLSKIRKKLNSVPILLILRVNDLKMMEIDWFFDEFLIYPFRKGEIILRLRRLLWSKNFLSDEDIIAIGNLKISVKEHSVYLNKLKLDLTYKEFELLKFLILNKGSVFSRKELLSKIWGTEYIGGTRTVDVHIRRLRVKLNEEEFNSIIETVRSVGYRCRVL